MLLTATVAAALAAPPAATATSPAPGRLGLFVVPAPCSDKTGPFGTTVEHTGCGSALVGGLDLAALGQGLTGQLQLPLTVRDDTSRLGAMVGHRQVWSRVALAAGPSLQASWGDGWMAAPGAQVELTLGPWPSEQDLPESPLAAYLVEFFRRMELRLSVETLWWLHDGQATFDTELGSTVVWVVDDWALGATVVAPPSRPDQPAPRQQCQGGGCAQPTTATTAQFVGLLLERRW